MARSSSSARQLNDHDEIREWAEERGGKPACVRGTGGGDDVGMIRLDFPGYSGADSLQEISWDEWFEKFDEGNLALLVQEETASGETSNFNKLVKRETAEAKSSGRRTAASKGAKTAKSAKAGGNGKSARTAKTAAKPARAAKTTKTAK